MRGFQARSEERCGNCKYFYRHYGRSKKGRYYALQYGHCVHPRLKNRRIEEHCACWTAIEKTAE